MRCINPQFPIHASNCSRYLLSVSDLRTDIALMTGSTQSAW